MWKRQILKVSYREKRISDFVSGIGGDSDEFRILDPTGSAYVGEKNNHEFTRQGSFKKALFYKADGLFYLSMVIISLTLGFVLLGSRCN